jgi:CheY-like chemotaxis protein
VDLNEIVEHMSKVRRYAIETGNVELRKDLADDLPTVLANPVDIEQVVLNLMVNAEQAMAEQKGERILTVRTRRTPLGAAIHVIDTGPGIPPQNLEQIFDPFFTTKAPGVGTGLGLSLVHNIVTEHGGQIHVESEIGKGSAFRVELPRTAPRGKSGRAGRAPHSPPASGSLRILVVDDEETIRIVSSRFLERLGHRVDVVADGTEALRHLARTDYDVILSDLRMPGLSGEELLERLRERGGGLERRLIFVTGDAAHGVGGTGVPVLIKPVRLEELARAVEYTVRARSG